MIFTPICICPQCKQEMLIAGTQCPFCQFSFTREMVDRFVFSCLKCRSPKIKIKLANDTGGGFDITVQKSYYSAILRIVESAIGIGRSVSFECCDCGNEFNNTSFLLQEQAPEEPRKTPRNREKIETTDAYGNRVEIIHYEDGSTKKTTFPDSGAFGYFEFLGDTYSKSILRACEDVKVYYRDNKMERVLKCDRYGRLLLYFYDDWGMDDRIDELWKVVTDEAEADEFVNVYRLDRLLEPYIAGDGGNWMAAHEWI